MFDATGLHHLRWRKKKVDGFIIPAKYFYGRVKDLEVESPEIVQPPTANTVNEKPDSISPANTDSADAAPAETVKTAPLSQGPKISAFSLSSIRAKKELEHANKSLVRDSAVLPTEPFTQTEMLEQWYKFAQKLVDSKRILMATNMQISEPVLNGSSIILELPNQSVKEEFEASKNELLGYLRGHLHNHDITIEVVVNETVENKFAFTTQDKYNRLNQINPTLDVLKKTFDLDI